MDALEHEKTNRLGKLINSPIFIWFLTFIVLGLLGLVYTKYDSYKENREIIFKLDTELKGRLQYIASQFKQVGEMEGSPIATAILSMEFPMIEPYPISVFSEYQKRNIRSLLWELHTRVCGGQKDEIQKAISAASEFRDMYEFHAMVDTMGSHMSTQLLEGLIIPEGWQASVTYVPGGNEHVIKCQFRPFDLARWSKPFTLEWGQDFCKKKTQ